MYDSILFNLQMWKSSRLSTCSLGSLSQWRGNPTCGISLPTSTCTTPSPWAGCSLNAQGEQSHLCLQLCSHPQRPPHPSPCIPFPTVSFLLPFPHSLLPSSLSPQSPSLNPFSTATLSLDPFPHSPLHSFLSPQSPPLIPLIIVPSPHPFPHSPLPSSLSPQSPPLIPFPIIPFPVSSSPQSPPLIPFPTVPSSCPFPHSPLPSSLSP